ncbi:MAG: hypothetical protein ACRETI_06550 [Steroidobacteraceae bacterium]
MAGGTARTIALALALCLGGQASFAARIVDPARARHAITNPAVVATQAQLTALAQDHRATELAARLDLIANDRTIPAVAQEWLLDGGLHALATIEPTPQARATVLRLAARAPIVYTRVDPDHGERVTPLYDVGATARFVLRAWERLGAQAAAQSDLAAGRISAIDRFAGRSGRSDLDPVRAGIADAFKAAPVPQIRGQRAAIAAAVGHGRRVDELALVLAERLRDPELFMLVFGHADASIALAAISSVARTLDPQTSFEVLAAASRRAEIASPAVLEIGRLARNDFLARRFLFDAIAEPDIGPSAAAALATLGDPGVTSELGRRLDAGGSEQSMRLLVLALKLDASATALESLERFAATKTGSAELRKEVRQWLER